MAHEVEPTGRGARRLACAIALLLAAGAAWAADDRRTIILDPQSPLPFSNGVLVGDTLYIAGHLGIDPKTGKPPGDAEEEARLVMENIRKVVEAAGMSMADLVMVQVYCTDLDLFATFNKVYRGYFKGELPARAFLGTDKLLFGSRFEVMGIAVRRR
jgi:reactive intermediate/imine deaminase